ncbi:MAG: copper resistance CopC family protein [Hyphomicrobiales bacterium]
MKSILLSICLFFTATTLTLAHSVVTSSTPENGARLSAAPESLDVSFSKLTRLVKASLSHNKGDTVTLAISTKEPTKSVSFTPVPKAAGNYVLKWRALSQDGHVLKGSLTFSIAEPK